MYITGNENKKAVLSHTESLTATCCSQYRLPSSCLCLIAVNWRLWLHHGNVSTLRNNYFPRSNSFHSGSVWVIVHPQPPNSLLSSCQSLMPAVEASPGSGQPQQDSPQPSKTAFSPHLPWAQLSWGSLSSAPGSRRPAFRCHLGILSNHRAAPTLAVLRYPHFCINLLMPQWGGIVAYETWASP